MAFYYCYMQEIIINTTNYAHGLYQVGNRQFINKTAALVEATRLNKKCHWNFHDSVYSAIDWTVRPSGTLTDLYRLRAQQIRDQYDYVIVHFSGGSDSWTVLDSFLSNGLHVDEVYTRWSRAERKYRTANNKDLRECNLGSEYEYAVEPVLKELQKKFPKTYIYMDDYSDAYTGEVDEKTLETGNHYTTMGTFHRFSRKSPGEQAALAQGKRIAVVYGFDKIQCKLINGQFFSYFLDRFGGTDVDPERAVEGFYWSPDMPEIPVMQSHDLKLYYQHMLELIRNKTINLRHTYISTCYPKYDLRTFQVGKAIGSSMWASEFWIRQYNPRYVESWTWALNQFSPTIDKCHYDFYKDKIKLGYKVIPSDCYYVGSINHAESISFEFTH